jgi:DNA-directed RNA polymerase specialized sigma24 family protein
MSTNVIALLYAVADTSGIPPGVPSEFEIESAPTDLVEAEAIVEDAAQENAAADQSTMLPETQAPGADPDLWLYRKRTVGLLRRYMRLSIEVGRLPSLLGREFFRTRVTSYRASTFEDAVIFVHDVERSLEKLSDFDKKVIAKTVLQEYPQEEAARLIGCGQRHLARCYVEALDRVSEIFLKRRLLLRLPCVKSESKNLVKGVKPMNLT